MNDTVTVSALINPERWSAEAGEFRDLVGGRVTLVSFVTVTEEHDLDRFVRQRDHWETP